MLNVNHCLLLSQLLHALVSHCTQVCMLLSSSSVPPAVAADFGVLSCYGVADVCSPKLHVVKFAAAIVAVILFAYGEYELPAPFAFGVAVRTLCFSAAVACVRGVGRFTACAFALVSIIASSDVEAFSGCFGLVDVVVLSCFHRGVVCCECGVVPVVVVSVWLFGSGSLSGRYVRYPSFSSSARAASASGSCLISLFCCCWLVLAIVCFLSTPRTS